MTVIVSVSFADDRFRVFVKNVCTVYVFRKKTYLNLHAGKLHGNIIVLVEDGDGGIFSHPACNTIVKAII